MAERNADLPPGGACQMRQPVHVFYAGAHLFRPDIVEKVSSVALRALASFDSPYRKQLEAKLRMEPIGICSKVLGSSGKENGV